MLHKEEGLLRNGRGGIIKGLGRLKCLVHSLLMRLEVGGGGKK